jgi:ABC-type transport system substrate-binding protein
MELNPNYKGVSRPYFSQIRGELTPTGLPAYIAGGLQFYSIGLETPAGEIGIVNSNPILRSESYPQPASFTDYIGFNTLGGEFAPLDNKDVRLALCKAYDKETIVGEIGRGFATPAWGILPPGFPNYAGDQLKTLDPNVYDVEAAKGLLAKAGYPDGKDFPKFEMWIRAPTQSQSSLCQAIQAQWKENLGIQVELRPATYDEFTEMAFSQKKAPIYFVSYQLDYYDPSTFLGVFRTDGGRHPNLDPQYDEFYLKAVSLLDLKKRAEQLVEAEKMLVNSAAYSFLWSPFGTSLWPCNLSGWMLEPNSDGYQQLSPPTAGGWTSEGLYWTNSTCRKGLK